MKFITLTLSLLQMVISSDPIQFKGYPLAESTIGNHGTILYANSTTNYQPQSAQFPYDKLTTDSVGVGLATVYLTGTGFKLPLQSNFAVITQTCSCYWLDAQDLKSRFPQLISGTKFSITIEGENFKVQSGSFGLDVGVTTTPSSPSYPTLPSNEPTTVNHPSTSTVISSSSSPSYSSSPPHPTNSHGHFSSSYSSDHHHSSSSLSVSISSFDPSSSSSSKPHSSSSSKPHPSSSKSPSSSKDDDTSHSLTLTPLAYLLLLPSITLLLNY